MNGLAALGGVTMSCCPSTDLWCTSWTSSCLRPLVWCLVLRHLVVCCASFRCFVCLRMCLTCRTCIAHAICSCTTLVRFNISLLHYAVVLHICCVLCRCSCNLSLSFSCAENYFWCVVQGVLRINYLLFPVQRKLWVGSSDSCCGSLYVCRADCTMLVSALSVLNTLHFTFVCCIGWIACFVWCVSCCVLFCLVCMSHWLRAWSAHFKENAEF